MEKIGFQPQMLDFLLENKLHDSKEWYDAHKAQYQKLVKEPFYRLAERMTPQMLKIDSQFMTEPARMLSRIRRDTRFTKDKSLYRDHAWIIFARSKKNWSSAPAYYVGINQDCWEYGCGFYEASTETLQIMRDMVRNEDPVFLKAYHALQKCSRFSFYGEEYKRPKFPDAPEKYQPWLNRKSAGVSCDRMDFETLFEGNFFEELMEDITTIAPYYHFLWAAESKRIHRLSVQNAQESCQEG